MKEYKTVLVCTDEILNKMALARWRIEHMQFEDGVLRVVFSRIVEVAPAVISDSVPVATNEPKQDVNVLVGVDATIYGLRPMRPVVYPQNLIEVKPHHHETVEERKAKLDAQILDGMRAYWDEANTSTPSRPLLLLGEVSNG